MSEVSDRSLRGFVAIDVGGSWTRGVMIDSDSGIIAARFALPTPRDLTAGFSSLILYIYDHLAMNQVREIVGLGVAIACPIDRSGCVLVDSGKLGLHEGVDLRGLIDTGPNIPIVFESELRASAIGEIWSQDPLEDGTFAVLTVGTGVGAAMVYHGQLLAAEFSGEIGHVPVNLTEAAELCSCGRRGCLEAYLGWRANERASKRPGNVVGSTGDNRMKNEVAPDDPNLLGLACAMCINIYGVRSVVLRGGLAMATWKAHRSEVTHSCANRSLLSNFEIRSSELGDDGPLFGLWRLWSSGS